MSSALGATVRPRKSLISEIFVILRISTHPSSPEMALRIEAWLGIARGGEARLWLAQQSAYDLWQADLRFKSKPMRVTPAP